MPTSCLYPALAGSHSTRALWPDTDEPSESQRSLIEDLIDALKRKQVSPRDCETLCIPLIDDTRFKYSPEDDIWVPVDKITVDALIAIQASPYGASVLMSDLFHQDRRSPVLQALRAMPTLSHCAALWGYLSIQDLLSDYRSAPSTSPVSRDLDTCRGMLRALKDFVLPHTQVWLHNITAIHRTPCHPVAPIPGDVRESLLDLTAERISSCLSHHRPVHFLFVDAAPTAAIADLIRHAQEISQ